MIGQMNQSVVIGLLRTAHDGNVTPITVNNASYYNNDGAPLCSKNKESEGKKLFYTYVSEPGPQLGSKDPNNKVTLT